MLSKMQSKVGINVCWSDLSRACTDEERKAAMREFERIWARDIRNWQTRLLEYARDEGDSDVIRFLESYLMHAPS